MGNFADLPDFGDARATDEIAVVRGGRTGRAHPVGDGPLIRNDFDGTTGTGTGEAEVAGVTIENSQNVAYLIRVRASTEYALGSALYALRAAAPLEIGIANFYSKGGGDAGKLFRTLDEATDDTLEIWRVNDLAAIRSVIGAAGKTDAQIGDAAFSNPPGDLSAGEKTAARQAIGASDFDGAYGSLSGRPDLSGIGTDATARAAAAAAQMTAGAALPKAGGTMTGALTLHGAPAADLEAATKRYVDENAGGAPIESAFDGTLGSDNGEVELAGVTIENDANVSYLLQVGDDRRYILGDALHATRAATPVSLGPAHFYSKGGGDAGKLYQDIQTSWVSDTVLSIWKVNDVAGLQAVLGRIEPDHVDELRDDLAKLHAYIAEHVTTTSTEVMDPTQADSPAHYYLTKRARHTVNGVSVPFETGLYELTAGVANKVKVKLAKSGNWWGVNTREYGGTPNRGSILHNPLSMLVAWWVDQDSGGDHWMHAVIKGRVYDLLRTRYNLANTAIFFRATDGSNEHWFEMGQVGETNIGGDQFYLMRDHLTPSPSLRDGFLAWFTAGNENAPTIDIAFNQSFPDAGRDNSPVGYTIAGSGTTKAYTFRADNFAGITGLNDQFIESASIDRKVVLTQAQYDALAAKDARTEYCIVG